MQILTLSGHMQFSCLMLSRTIIKVDYHWFGRSVMCGGLACPACSFSRPKTYGYFAAIANREVRVVECCPSFYNGALSNVPLLSDRGMRGYVLRAIRGSKKTPWRFEQAVYKPELMEAHPEDEWLVPHAIANLYRCPLFPGMEEGGPAAFLNRCAVSQIPLLQGCVIE